MKTVKQILDRIEDAEKRVASIVLGAEGPVIFYSVDKPGVFYQDNALTKIIEPDRLRSIRERSNALIFLPANGRKAEIGGSTCPTS